MNVNSSSQREMSYAQMQNNFSSEMTGLQSNTQNSFMSESNEGRDNDGDDRARNSSSNTSNSNNANNYQALMQLLNKQNNTLYPTSNQNIDYAQTLSSQKALESLLMKGIESLYASPAQPYRNNPIDSFVRSVDIKA